MGRQSAITVTGEPAVSAEPGIAGPRPGAGDLPWGRNDSNQMQGGARAKVEDEKMIDLGTLSTFQAAAERMAEVLRRVGGAADRGAEAAREAVATTLQDPRAAGARVEERISDCVSATLDVMREIGGRVRDAARGAMLGATHGTKLEHAWATDTVETVASVLVRHAIEEREDLAPVMRAAIASAIEAARELGFSAEEAASAAARGAARVAAEHGPEL
jgi:hypothetical protein